MFTKTSAIALFAGIAAAVHAPVGDPSGNPITRPLNEVVPACKAFSITWQPTTTNTVSILLLRGPSTNVVPLGAPIAEGIANSGSFQWTPASSLEADTTHYGIQLIDDVTGQYQYSTQFGISKDDCKESSTPSAASTPSSTGGGGYGGGYGASTPAATPSETKQTPQPTGGYPVGPGPVNGTVTATPFGTSAVVHSTGAPVAHNSTIVLPSKPLTVPSSLQTATATGGVSTGTGSASLPESTGAASSLRTGFGLLGAAAGLAFML